MRRWANAIESARRLLDTRFALRVEATPGEVPDFFVNNLISRVISNPVVIGGGRSRLCEGLPQGIPYNYPCSGERYTCVQGLAPNAYTGVAIVGAGYVGYQLDVMIETHDALVQVIDIHGEIHDGIPILAGSMLTWDFPHSGVRIQNRVAASVAQYTFVSWQRAIVME